MQRVGTKIRSLKANVSREDAIRFFTSGIGGLTAAFWKGRARSLAELYLPYRIYQVRMRNRGREEATFYAIDAVEGTLDLFEFPQLPDELVTLETRNALPCRTVPERSRELLMNKVRRVVFSRGFIRLKNLELEATAIPGEVYVPYWVCFRGGDQIAKLAILDAVRRKPEGAKVRHLVEEWLKASSFVDSSSESGSAKGFGRRNL